MLALTLALAIESVFGNLQYSSVCTSSIELRNLSERKVEVDLEGHRSTGALAPLKERAGQHVELPPLGRSTFHLDIDADTAWVKVREFVPPGSPTAIAARGVTECVIGDQLRSAVSEAAFPTPSPWFSGDVAELAGSEIYVINTSDAAVTASGCYSAGALVSNPGRNAPGEWTPVCSDSFRVQVPPFGTRRFPVQRGNSTHLSIRTEGRGIVLQMLRPVDASVRLYRVDSTIKFGGEVAR